jgi:prepilin-type N-terminal cleavage/methylation domain-containing protein
LKRFGQPVYAGVHPLCYTIQVNLRGTGRARRGFSLIEILIAVAMIALGFAMLTGSLANFRSNRGVVRGDAELLAELLRSLRQQAITQHRPVGVGLPNASRAATTSTGYYVLEGEVRPKVVRRVPLVEGQAGQLTGGFWPEVPFSKPGNTFTGSQYSLASWEPPFPEDGLVMFLPSGEMLTNLPVHQGQAALVLARSIEARWGSVDSQPAIEIVRAQTPMVVWCSILGEIHIEAGLKGSATRSVASPVASTGMAGVPPLTNDANAPPRFDVTRPLTISPPPNANTLGHVASGMTGTLRKDRYVSLKIAAVDPNGDQLWCDWSCVGSSKTSVFTKKGPVRMAYNPQTSKWESTWAWHAPVDADSDEAYRLQAVITDGRGGSAQLSSSLSGNGDFKILAPGFLAFTRGGNTWMSNWDGTDPVIVAKGLTAPRWSRDGTALVVRNGDAGTQLWVISPDGRSRRQVVNEPAGTYVSPGTFDDDDDDIGYVTVGAAPNSLKVKVRDVWEGPGSGSAWGDASVLIPFTQADRPVVDFHTEGKWMLLSTSAAAGGPMYLVSDDQTVPLDVTGSQASWSSDGTEIVFRTAADANQFEVRKLPLADPMGATAVVDPIVVATGGRSGLKSPRFSPGSTGPRYVVGEIDDGGTPNCCLFWGAVPELKLFQQPSAEPDWSR